VRCNCGHLMLKTGSMKLIVLGQYNPFTIARFFQPLIVRHFVVMSFSLMMADEKWRSSKPVESNRNFFAKGSVKIES